MSFAVAEQVSSQLTEQVLGPFGALVLALAAIWFLSRILTAYIADLKRDRDDWKEIALTAAGAAEAAVGQIERRRRGGA